MRFLDQDAPIPMHTNSAGQLLIDVLDFPVSKAGASRKDRPQGVQGQGEHKGSLVEVLPVGISESAPIPSVQPQDQRDPVEISSPSIPDPKIRPDDVPTPVPGISRTKPPKSKITLKKKECRCLLSQWTRHANDQDAQIAVAELFSEPRLSEEARRHGASGVAFDIKQGCDLTDPQTQKEVDELLDQARPKSLTASPPCTYWGGWDHLNKCHRTPVERARLIRIARRQVKFSVEQIHKQLRRGGDFLLEHPIGSSIWREPAVRELKRKYGFHRVDMCAYGLKDPKSGRHVRKGTGIICSNPAFAQHVRTCPGNHVHATVSGSDLCQHVAKYTPQFVRAMWTCLVPPPQEPAASRLDWEVLKLYMYFALRWLK